MTTPTRHSGGGSTKAALTMRRGMESRLSSTRDLTLLNSRYLALGVGRVDLILTNCLHNFSRRTVWADARARVASPIPGAGPRRGLERLGPFWDRFWAGERERLGLPPVPTVEEVRLELIWQWREGMEKKRK